MINNFRANQSNDRRGNVLDLEISIHGICGKEDFIPSLVSRQDDFPGPEYDEALNGPRERLALGVMPDPLPPEAPVARVTLSRQGIVTARALMIALTGKDKRKVLEQAIEQGPSSPYPIGRVLADAELPVDIHWAP